MGRRSGLSCVTLLGSILATTAHANLLVNGSFETGPAVGDAVQLAAGSTAIAGWVVMPSNVDYVGTRWSAAQGGRSVGLNGSATGAIAQTIATLPGARYGVRFYMAGDPDTEPVIKHLRVAAAGQSADFSVDLTGMWSWDPGWNPRVWTFTAYSTSTTLQFTSLEGGEAGPSIDSVTVASIQPVDANGRDLAAFALSAVSPNPMRGFGHVDFSVPTSTPVHLAVFDVRGHEVATLRRGDLAAGRYGATWDGNAGALQAPAGIYFIVLQAGDERRIQRVVLMR